MHAIVYDAPNAHQPVVVLHIYINLAAYLKKVVMVPTVLFMSVMALAAVVVSLLFISAAPSTIVINPKQPKGVPEGNKGNKMVSGSRKEREEDPLHHTDVGLGRRLEPYSIDDRDKPFPNRMRERGEEDEVANIIQSYDNASIISGLDLFGNGRDDSSNGDGGRVGDAHVGRYPQNINHRGFGDMIELEDSATSNSWFGPVAGTMTVIWLCISSDSLGINLAAGSFNSGVYFSRDSGATWTLSTGGYPISNIYWVAIASSSSGQFVAVGNQNTPGQLWTSINYGQSFALAASYSGTNQRFFLGGLAMSSNGTLVIAAVSVQGVLRYVLDTDSAGSLTLIGAAYGGFGAVAVSSDASFTILTFGVSYGGIYYSSDSGSTWLQSNAPTTNQYWYGITSSANGKYLAAGTFNAFIFYSKDSGVTWAASTSAPIAQIIGLSSSYSGQTMVAATNGYGSKIYLSFNYGKTWQASTSPAATWYGVAVSDDGGTIYGASYESGIYKSFSSPTSQPSSPPSSQPSRQPFRRPSSLPSLQPTSNPSSPSSPPSMQPSRQPSRQPNAQPSRQPNSNPSTQPSLQPFHRPTSQPSLNPSSNPSSQPFSFPSSQPSAYPTHNNIITSDVVSSVPYSFSLYTYSATHIFTNLGVNENGDNNVYYLQVKLASTSLSSTPLIFQVNVGESNMLIGSCSLVFPKCDIDSNGDVLGGVYSYLCLINQDVTSYIEPERGGTLNLTTTVSNFDNPCNTKVAVSAQYILKKGQSFPTFAPTSALNAASAKLSIQIDGNASLYAIFFFTVLYATYAVLICRIRDTNLGYIKVAPLPFAGTVVRFALLGLNVSAEVTLLIKLSIKRYDALFSVILIARLLQVLPSLYFQKQLLPLRYTSLMVRRHNTEFSYQYGILYILSFIQLEVLQYLPWKNTPFARKNGFPDLYLFNLINYYELCRYIVSIICQLIFTQHLSLSESLKIENIFVYFSIISSFLIILIFAFELFVRMHYVNDDAKEIEKTNHVRTSSSMDKSTEMPSIESGLKLGATVSKMKMKTTLEDMSAEDLHLEINKCMDHRMTKLLDADESEEIDLRIKVYFDRLLDLEDARSSGRKSTIGQMSKMNAMRKFSENAYNQMLSLIPSTVFRLNPSELLSLGMSTELAHRIYTKRCLRLVWVHPSDLQAVLTDDSDDCRGIRPEYHVSIDTRLDLIELGALYVVASRIQTFDDGVGGGEEKEVVGVGNGNDNCYKRGKINVTLVGDSSSNPLFINGLNSNSTAANTPASAPAAAHIEWKKSVESLFERMFGLYEKSELQDNQVRHPAYFDQEGDGDVYRNGFGYETNANRMMMLSTSSSSSRHTHISPYRIGDDIDTYTSSIALNGSSSSNISNKSNSDSNSSSSSSTSGSNESKYSIKSDNAEMEAMKVRLEAKMGDLMANIEKKSSDAFVMREEFERRTIEAIREREAGIEAKLDEMREENRELRSNLILLMMERKNKNPDV